MKTKKVESLFNEGVQLYEKKQFDNAAQKLEEALQLAPESEEIKYNLALSYFGLKKYDSVINIIKEINNIDCKELICELIKNGYLNQNKAKQTNKIGCPKCGSIVHNTEWRCPECYCEFENYAESEMSLKKACEKTTVDKEIVESDVTNDSSTKDSSNKEMKLSEEKRKIIKNKRCNICKETKPCLKKYLLFFGKELIHKTEYMGNYREDYYKFKFEPKPITMIICNDCIQKRLKRQRDLVLLISGSMLLISIIFWFLTKHNASFIPAFFSVMTVCVGYAIYYNNKHETEEYGDVLVKKNFKKELKKKSFNIFCTEKEYEEILKNQYKPDFEIINNENGDKFVKINKDQ